MLELKYEERDQNKQKLEETPKKSTASQIGRRSV